MAGLVGFGAYVPEQRITSKEIQSVWPAAGRVPGIQTKAVTDYDEDVVTMGVTAAERAFAQTGVDPKKVGAVYFASTSTPCEEKSAAAVVQTVLGIPSEAVPVDISRSTRAGTIALQTCLSQVESGQISLGLVIAADSRLAPGGDMLEHSQGAGAVALLIGNDGIVAKVLGWSSASSEYTTIWRPAGEKFLRRHDDARVERESSYQRTVLKAGKDLLNRLSLTANDISHLAGSEPDGACLQKLSKPLGIASETLNIANIAPRIGDIGTASALIGLVSVLLSGKPGEKCLLLSYGPGIGSDACVVELTANIVERRNNSLSLDQIITEGRKINYPAYAKLVGVIPVALPLPDPISGYSSQPNMYREAEYVLGLTAQVCRKCGSLNFPYRDYCIDCRGQEFDRVKLPRRGKLVTFNIQYVMAIGPEEGPIVVGTIKLDGAAGERGGKVASAMVTCDVSKVHIGMPVELVFRRCGIELGIPKYGYKFQPIADSPATERGE